MRGQAIWHACDRRMRACWHACDRRARAYWRALCRPTLPPEYVDELLKTQNTVVIDNNDVPALFRYIDEHYPAHMHRLVTKDDQCWVTRLWPGLF